MCTSIHLKIYYVYLCVYIYNIFPYKTSTLQYSNSALFLRPISHYPQVWSELKPPHTLMPTSSGWWLVSTHLKNMLGKMGSSSPNRGENKKYLSCHHQVRLEAFISLESQCIQTRKYDITPPETIKPSLFQVPETLCLLSQCTQCEAIFVDAGHTVRGPASANTPKRGCQTCWLPWVTIP